jgi:organic hydroperoxide reductase OsmC/OhrA
MAEQVYQYATTVAWTRDRLGKLAAASRPEIAIGAPTEFGGSDDVWSPEHLCVAAVNSCVMLTFIAIAGNSKVSFRAYSAAATGTLEKVEGRGLAITRISVKPRITVGSEVERAKVERLVKMAEKNCYISNSLQAQVTVEPDIVVE